MPRRLPATVLAAALGAVPLAAAADPFEAAIHYTVKVRSAIPVPFIHDEGQGGTGAGFLVDRGRGWIVTNAHVAGYGPSRVEVSFHGGAFVDARVRYTDPHLDLSVLAVPPGRIPASARVAPYDCDARPGTGTNVIAFGHPWDFDYTATRGIVSGISTRWDAEWIQTDAPLNGGNSGGPLISLASGRVVGINTASLGGKQVQNLNFAVPMYQACPVLALLRDGVDPTPAALPFTVAVREHGRGGLVVARVPEGERLGLRPGDRIVGVDGDDEPPANLTALYRHLRGARERIRLTLERDGRERSTTVPITPTEPVTARAGLLVAGILFAPVTGDFARAAGRTHLMVHWVEGGTPGAGSGLKPFDIVEAVNGESVRSLDGLAGVIRATPDGGELSVVIRRLINGASWWRYSERVLPAAPVRRVSRATPR